VCVFQFLRLQGKNQRGKEEIHFIDVNADDFISTADYQKALSEETEYRSSHKKKDGPTSQQKRKHHITYLAHQVLFSQYIYIDLMYYLWCRKFTVALLITYIIIQER
jgi:hypothetical protein